MKDFILSLLQGEAALFFGLIFLSIGVVLLIDLYKKWYGFSEEGMKKKITGHYEELEFDYTVNVKRKDGNAVERIELFKEIGVSEEEYNNGYFIFIFNRRRKRIHRGKVYANQMKYFTNFEEQALSLYANAKRNLDPKIYSVSFTNKNKIISRHKD